MSDVHLYIDDVCFIPPQFTDVVRTSEAAIEFLSKVNKEELMTIGFDHDMGHDENFHELTSKPVLLWMIENNVWPRQIFIHSSNIWGARWLKERAQDHAPETTSIDVINNKMYWE